MNKHTAHPVRPAPTRVHEQVTRTLLRRIMRGELPIGSKLTTERALAAEFQVNRATVREALRYLENLELIAIRQGDGAYVQNVFDSGNLETAKAMMQVDGTLRIKVLRAILEVRRINSPEIAHAAALNRSDAHLAQLEQVVFKQSDQPVMERDRAVHRIIGLASGNIVQILLTNFCLDFYDAFGQLYFEKSDNIERSEIFHRQIFEAVRDQNAGIARTVMRDVLAYADQAVLKAIDENGAFEAIRTDAVG